MGTITITSAGFTATPATTPPLWPVGVTYPASVAPNGSRSATLTDTEMLDLITWAAASQIPQGTATNPTTPTITQILVAWVGTFFNGTKAAVQNYFTTPAVPPAQINLN